MLLRAAALGCRHRRDPHRADPLRGPAQPLPPGTRRPRGRGLPGRPHRDALGARGRRGRALRHRHLQPARDSGRGTGRCTRSRRRSAPTRPAGRWRSAPSSRIARSAPSRTAGAPRTRAACAWPPLATAATPLMLALGLSRSALAAVGIDWLSPAVRRLYRQEELGAHAGGAGAADGRGGAPGRLRRAGGGRRPRRVERGHLPVARRPRVAVAEREAFPRFHVGESLLPANLPVLERLGVLDEVKARGFFVKYGAYFHDQEMDLGYQFFFREGKPWPPVHLRGPARRVRQDPARPRGPPAERDAAAARDASSAWPSTTRA